jgi:hypothetical protein
VSCNRDYLVTWRGEHLHFGFKDKKEFPQQGSGGRALQIKEIAYAEAWRLQQSSWGLV